MGFPDSGSFDELGREPVRRPKAAEAPKEAPKNLSAPVKAVIVLGPLIILVAVLAMWCFDAPAIRDDYTAGDLRSAPPDCTESYSVLMELAQDDMSGDDSPAVGLTRADVILLRRLDDLIAAGDRVKIVEAIKADAAGIERAWIHSANGRDIIKRLSKYDEIADQGQAVSLYNAKGCPTDSVGPGLRNLAYLYEAHGHMQVIFGHAAQAAGEVVELSDVLDKLHVNIRSLRTKLVCITASTAMIRTASFIVNDDRAERAVIEMLAKRLEPVTDEQVSLNNGLLFEYLVFRKTLATEDGSGRLPTFKQNSALRVFRNMSEKLMAARKEKSGVQLAAWPRLWPIKTEIEFDESGRMPWLYKLYNPIGAGEIEIMAPQGAKIVEIPLSWRVQDDLLWILINKRLGREVDFNARAYGSQYVVDAKTRKILSPGPDKQVRTPDDISLPVNTNVIGL